MYVRVASRESAERKTKTIRGQQLNRVCKKCVPNRFKPDRCHHCATCDRYRPLSVPTTVVACVLTFKCVSLYVGIGVF